MQAHHDDRRKQPSLQAWGSVHSAWNLEHGLRAIRARLVTSPQQRVAVDQGEAGALDQALPDRLPDHRYAGGPHQIGLLQPHTGAAV